MMDTVHSTLTVFFDGSFWVGVYERRYRGNLEVAKIVFGAEPKDYEIYQYLLSRHQYLKFSPQIMENESLIPKKRVNPKRMQRDIEKQLENKGIGTKAQQALCLQREAKKQCISQLRKEKKEQMLQRIFAQKQQKKKEKHRGR